MLRILSGKWYRMAYMDSMTCTFNRNAFEERKHNLRKNRKKLQGLSVAVVDLNRLKSINDSFGHHIGDEALKCTAAYLKEAMGANSDIYRIGGDEFVCMAYRDIGKNIEGFRELVEKENEKRPYDFSVAVGMAFFDEAEGGIDELMRLCDKRMYEEKRKMYCSESMKV